MHRFIRYALAIVGAVAVTTWCRTAQAGDLSQYASRTQLEEHARELDRRVVELQHDLMAARHSGNLEDRTRAEADLKNVQAERVETLRTLGALR